MASFFDNLINKLTNQEESKDPNKFMYNQSPSRFGKYTDRKTGEAKIGVKPYGLSNLLMDVGIGGLTNAYNAYNQGAGAGGQWLSLITGALGSASKENQEAKNYQGFYNYKKGVSDMYPDITPVLNGAQSIDQVQKAVDDYNSYLGNYRQIREPGTISDFEAGKTFKIGSQPSQPLQVPTPILRDKFDPYVNINNYTMNGADDPFLISHGIRSKEQPNTLIAGGIEKEKMPTPLEMLNNPEYYTKAFEQGAGYNTGINPQARQQQAGAVQNEIENTTLNDRLNADLQYKQLVNKYYPGLAQSLMGQRNATTEYLTNFKQNNTAFTQVLSTLNNLEGQLKYYTNKDNIKVLKKQGWTDEMIQTKTIELQSMINNTQTQGNQILGQTAGINTVPPVQTGNYDNQVSNILNNY